MWPQIPSTSSTFLSVFASAYKRLAQFKENVLSIHISSGLSGTINSARLGAAEMVETPSIT